MSKALRGTPKGFTLIELLIVISIVAALAVTIFAALSPAQRLKSARDAQRRSGVAEILSAIHQYISDDPNSSYPTGLSAGMAEAIIGTGNAATCSPVTSGGCNVVGGTACIDLATPLAKYLKSMPLDPSNGTISKTNYSVVVDTNNIVTIKACGTEGLSNISISR